MDTISLKEIQSKLLLWEAHDNPLAPLTPEQKEAVMDLESLILGVSSDFQEVCTFLNGTCMLLSRHKYLQLSFMNDCYKASIFVLCF